MSEGGHQRSSYLVGVMRIEGKAPAAQGETMKTTWQVATAAEAFAAAQFSRFGWDVSVQYGANQPEYDLVAVDRDRVLKVSVKGSKDGSWGITQSYVQNADYHGAADKWLARHTRRTVLCLVQFKDVGNQELPRMYLATPVEIVAQLKQSAAGRGETVIYEHHTWGPRAFGAGTTDRVPETWRFTVDRINEVLTKAEQEVSADA